MDISPLVVAVVGVVAVIVVVALLVARRIQVAGPNQAFIITGRKGKAVRDEHGIETTDLSGQKVIMGASVFVLPFVQRLHVMDLSSRRISVNIKGAISKNGIKVELDGVAIVKVGGNENLVRAAAQRFLDQQNEIEPFTQEVLAGSLRSIVGGLTVEEVIRDRAAFAAKVAEEAETSLTGQGLVLDAFQIQDVRTEGSYLDDLGRPEAARARQEASIAEARATQASERERLLAEEAIAVSQRQLELRRAEIQAETDAARAQAEASGPLARAEREQAVLAEEEKVAERRAALKERELDTEIRRPADAERYRVEQEAESRKRSRIADAEAAQTSTIAAAEAAAREAELLGAGDKARRVAVAEAAAREAELTGEGDKARRVAAAEAVRVEGEAHASAILVRGQAEAEAMERKADAFAQYGQAATLEMLVSILPEMVAKAAEPLGNIDKMTVISTDGAAHLPRQVAGNLAQGMQIVSDLTGIDLAQLLAGVAARAGTALTESTTDPTPRSDTNP